MSSQTEPGVWKTEPLSDVFAPKAVDTPTPIEPDVTDKPLKQVTVTGVVMSAILLFIVLYLGRSMLTPIMLFLRKAF